MAEMERQNTASADNEQTTGADRSAADPIEEEARDEIGGFRRSSSAEPIDVALEEAREDEEGTRHPPA